MRHNIELRLSLRALEANGKNIDRVFVVGNKPEFLNNNVNYIWVDDKYQWWRNAFEKTKAAINGGISEDFLLMNDDFFMMQEFDAEKYPYYYRGDLPETDDRDYTDVLASTRKILEREGKGIKHFGVHCPIRINAKQYLELEKYKYEPFSARCLYGNLFIKGARKVNDCKGDMITPNATKCFSSKDWMTDEVIKALKENFNKPSKWEKEDV